MDCLHEIFEAQADGWPDDVAVVHRGNSHTFGEIESRANRLARHLRSLGAAPGKLVGLHLERSDNAIVAILAVLKSGAAYVPLDPSYPEDRILHIIKEASVRLLVTETELAHRVRHPDVTVVVTDAPDDQRAIAALPDARIPREESGVSAEDLCYVIYTSGTTGRPKGIMTEHRNVFGFTAAFNEICRLDPNDRVYQGFSLSFDGSVEEIWAAFSNGAILVIGPQELARLGDETAEYMVENGVTYFSTVPTFLSMMKKDVPNLRTIVVSGEPCPPELIRRWVRPGRRMLNVYGPTEATVNTTAWECVPGAPVTIGRPLRGYETLILDSEQRPVRGGEAGELYIGGVGLARGYLGQPELTEAAFVQDPTDEGDVARRLYRTGDLVRESADGELIFLGRIDGQVKIRGYRIELSEIEAVLREHGDIGAAAAAVFEHDGLSELAAYVVPHDSDLDGVDRDSVLELLRRRLPPYMVPAYMDTIDALPTLASGKVDRKRLPVPVTPLFSEKRDIVEPRSELERRIARVWEDVFRTSPISVEDDFFLDLGGYSLLVAQFVALLERDEELEVSLREVYENPTISALARMLEGRRDAGKSREPEEVSGPTSREVFEGLGRARRFACVALQTVSVIALYGLAALPFVFLSYLWWLTVEGRMSVSGGVGVILAAMLISFPAWVALMVGLKWIVIGRYRQGEWPVWGLYYFRFWLASRIHGMSGIALVSGTPLMNVYYRMMGARVGYGCVIDTPHCVAFDLVSIGDDSSIGAETQLLGYRVEDGMLRTGRVDIGSRCFVGIHSALGLNVRMGNDSRLGDLSMLPDGGEIEVGQSMKGSPSAPGDVPVPDPSEAIDSRGRPLRSVVGASLERRHPVVFGLLHWLLVWFLELVLVLTLLPALLVVALGFTHGAGWGTASLIAAVPVGILSFCLIIAGAKALILKRMEPGVYKVESALYLRKWLADALMRLSRVYMHPIYTTIYLPPWLRLMGARIGRLAEISTVSQVTPDLIDIEDESFFADGSMIGGRRFFRGRVQVGRNKIGRRSFVGNNAVLPIGTSIGRGCLLGVLSTPPEGRDTAPDGTEWLGSPSFRLPYRVRVGGFDESVTYSPTRKLYAQRYVIDALRILIPGYIATAEVVLFAGAVMVALSLFPTWCIWPLSAVLGVGVALGSSVSVAILKKVVMGTFRPVVKPLWSTYVWWNEMINGAYETVAAPILAPLLGTPFFNSYLRLMGCRIGRHVFIETTLFSEFDLVCVGDHAALNFGVVVQNHLFEDRIMKSSYVKIGDESSIGNMSVVLYDTEMGRASSLAPLSLLMKGETVPGYGRRAGIPAGHASS